MESVPECSVTDQSEKCSIFWQTHTNAISLDNSIPADCLEKVVQTTNENNSASKDSFVTRCVTKKYPQECLSRLKRRPNSARLHGEPVADELTRILRTVFRIQGISRSEVEQDEEKCRKQYIGSSIITNRKGFKLCEISPQIQCPYFG